MLNGALASGTVDRRKDFVRAAVLLRVLAAPIRLQILGQLCEGEKNVSELLARVATTQPNMSQHLKVLHSAKIIERRREGSQVYYRVRNHGLVDFCGAFCALIDEQTVQAAQSSGVRAKEQPFS